MVEPWLAAGYECWIVDARHPAGEHHEGMLVRVGADIRTWLPPYRSFAAAFAFTPCTDVANSGNRWKQAKGLTALHDAIGLFAASVRLLEWTCAPWMLENPIGSLSTYWRKPDYTFQPWHFGDLESKATCLWTGGGFVMPAKQIEVRPVGVKESCWKMGPSADRGFKRSVTPPGFARAVFEANQVQDVRKMIAQDTA